MTRRAALAALLLASCAPSSDPLEGEAPRGPGQAGDGCGTDELPTADQEPIADLCIADCAIAA